MGVEKSLEVKNNREDSLKWDYEMFKEDLKYIDEEPIYPIQLGVFPTPKYNLLGNDSFKGLGFYTNKIEVNGKSILTVGFYFNNNKIYSDTLKNNNSFVFFKIIILLGNSKIDKEINHTMISSRNQPSYIGQGSCTTKDIKIDYLSFITPKISSYAIVNMRLFDLNEGSTIIIAPQKDKSLRSLQLQSEEIITKDKLEIYFENLLQKSIVKEFLNDNENIK
jgi:hypothetical protein